jgi:CheY-like chemotaxis protein
LQALGTLAGGIAHDFNNLLAAVIGNLELAGRRAGADEKLGRFLGNAAEAAKRGTALSQRLLSFSRQRDLTAEVFEPDAAARSIEDLIVRSTAGLVSLRYIEPPAAPWWVRADRGQFELALVNLCINARDAMPRGGEIVMATRNIADDLPPGLAGAYVAISVTDSGAGMSGEVLARVFEPFFTTKAIGQGTGLGLPMVHAMTEAVGGTTTIESAPGAGTTVTMWLPRVERPEPAAATIAPPPSTTRALRVLIVEDDPQVRSVAAAHLADLGHAQVAAESGDAALALVVTDHAMPGLSGGELAEIVAERWPGMRVLMVTGFADLAERPHCTAVLTKPFTRDALVLAIDRAMAGA